MKTIKVVAAVICDSFQNKTQIFATARGYGVFKGLWQKRSRLRDGIRNLHKNYY